MRQGSLRPWLALTLLGTFALLPARGEQGQQHSFPRIEVTPGPDTELRPGTLVRIEITVRDPDGNRVSLRIPAPPPGFDFQPTFGALPPFRTAVEWSVPTSGVPRRTVLALEAEDARGNVTRLAVPYRIPGVQARVVAGDVTGDGLVDVVAAAREADLQGLANAGAVYVWAERRAHGRHAARRGPRR